MKDEEKDKTGPEANNPGNNKNEKAKSAAELKTRQEGVKKGAVSASVVGIIVLLVAAIIGYSLYSHDHKELMSLMDSQKTSLTDKIVSRDSIISEWITTFDDIEKNIALIKEKEKIISSNSSNAEISKDKKQLVLDDIKYINTLLEQNKKKIASLTAQLKNSGGTIKALQIKISNLETSMKQSEEEIAQLKNTLVDKKFEIDQLNTQMTGLQDTISIKNETIVAKTNELNKAFYVCGTFKELKAKGLLTKEGGFIGLGKTESLTANFSNDAFTQVDISDLKSIPVNAKSAKLISDHPAASYELIRDKDKKIESINIINPAEFWKISKYAVVEITK